MFHKEKYWGYINDRLPNISNVKSRHPIIQRTPKILFLSLGNCLFVKYLIVIYNKNNKAQAS